MASGIGEVRSQGALQARFSQTDSALQGAFGYPQHLGRLRRGSPLDVKEEDRVALCAGETLQGFADPEFEQVVSGLNWGRQRHLRRTETDETRESNHGLYAAMRLISDDPVQEAFERAVSAKAASATKQGHDGVVDDVLRIRAHRREPPSPGEQERRVLSIEAKLCGFISGLALRDEAGSFMPLCRRQRRLRTGGPHDPPITRHQRV